MPAITADRLIALLEQFVTSTGQPVDPRGSERMMETAVPPLRFILLSSLVFVAAGFWGCDSERSRLMKDDYPSYSEGVRRSIDGGTIMRGMNQDQVYLALGSPVCKREIQDQGRPVQVWLYPPIGRDACITADFRVYFEEGRVTTWDRFIVPTRHTDPAGGVPAY